MPYKEFFNRVASELGVAVPLSSPPDILGVPKPLTDFYSVTNGLRLPFAEIYPIADVHAHAEHPRFGRSWMEIGIDGYSTYYLVSTDPAESLPITAFDPESETSPEPVYTSLLELLEDEYGRFVENEFRAGDLHVTGIPESTPWPRVLQELKRVSPIGSSELLRGLKEGPFMLTSVSAPAGIAAVRKLRALGVTAFLKNVRPERAG